MTTDDAIEIDGARGEGGGQVLRSALSLSLITGRAIVVENIRAGRRKPGVLRQHLTAIRAAAAIGRAHVEGDELGSKRLRFNPGQVEAGNYEFRIGSAGSALLVLETVLPPLLKLGAGSRVLVEGGTHNPMAPPYEFVSRVFAPLIRRLGYDLELELERPGYVPAGGGRVVAKIGDREPSPRFELSERGSLLGRKATAVVAHLPQVIAHRELKRIANRLGFEPSEVQIHSHQDSLGPGNVIFVEHRFEQVTELFTGFGRRGRPAEAVADQVVDETSEYLAHTAPVGPYLADQLLLPLALAGEGSFRTGPLTRHTQTQIDLIPEFLPVDINVAEDSSGRNNIRLGERRNR